MTIILISIIKIMMRTGGFFLNMDVLNFSLRKENIDYLRSNFNVSQLHFIASDGYSNHMRETLANMDEDVFELYLKYHFSICERQDMVGLSHHTLDIFRKD